MADLRALLAAATPGPWERSTEGHADIDGILAKTRAALEANPLQTDATFVLCNEGTGTVALIGNGPKQTDNAALIVEAVNALPALLDIVDAAKELAEQVETWNASVLGIIGRVPQTGMGTDRLREALAHLEDTHAR